jgi:hypothetical protein
MDKRLSRPTRNHRRIIRKGYLTPKNRVKSNRKTRIRIHYSLLSYNFRADINYIIQQFGANGYSNANFVWIRGTFLVFELIRRRLLPNIFLPYLGNATNT